MQDFDVIVVGGGPAGLSAALYLARYNRRVGLFDAGQGRSTWHQVNHNYLGFPGGVPARHIRELGYEQLADYPNVTVLKHKISKIRRHNGVFIAWNQGHTWCARAVILCTGVVDHYPHFPEWHHYVGRSMFWCITCDGFGTTGKRIVVQGDSDDAASMALQLTRFDPASITLLTHSRDHTISAEYQRRLHKYDIPLICERIERVVGDNGYFRCLLLCNGERLELDQLFSHHGATPQTDLARQLGVLLSEKGYIHVDTEQKTNVGGVYAAGDVTRLHSHQISTAVHEGGQAASAANYYLYPPDLKDP